MRFMRSRRHEKRRDISHAATIDPDRRHDRRELMINGVRRADFYAKQKRNVFIRLPKENEDAKEGEVGQLLLCLYGTRDSAKEWHGTLSDHLVTLGLEPGKWHTRVFHHSERGISVLVHGDDYFSSAHREQVDWLEKGRGEKYEIQLQRIGSDEGCDPEGKILNRIVRWTPAGYEIEADP